MKLPYPTVSENDTCVINKGKNARCILLQNTKLIVYDEASAAHKNILDCIHNTLTDLRDTSSDNPFGGITFLIAGDFQQCLPIIKGAGPSQILKSTLQHSVVWKQNHVHKKNTFHEVLF